MHAYINQVPNYGPVSINDTPFAKPDVLMHMDTSVTADVNPKNVWTIPGGTVVLDSAQSKFGGFSASFDNVGRLTTSFNPYYDLADTPKWSVDAWVFLVGTQATMSTSRISIFGASTAAVGFEAGITRTGMAVTYPGGGTGPVTTTTISSGVWHHLAWGRSDNDYYFGFDGVVTNVTNSAVDAVAKPTAMRIGGNVVNNTSISYFLEEVRVVVGTPLFVENYTVPASPYPSTTTIYDIPEDPYYYSTILHFDGQGPNGEGIIVDKARGTESARASTAVITSNAQSKFGDTSYFFPGAANDRVEVDPGNRILYFGAGIANSPLGFSIETWIFPAASQTNTTPFFFSNGGVPTVTNVWGLAYSHSVPGANTFSFFAQALNGGSTPVMATPASYPPGVWYHVMLSRVGSIYTIHVDGILAATATNTASLDGPGNATPPFYFGGSPSSGGRFTGYMEQIRVSRVPRLDGSESQVPTGPFQVLGLA